MHGSRTLFLIQLAITALVTVFLIVPVILSIAAGLTVNYFQGIWKSGVTLSWLGEVLNLYSDTIVLSIEIALGTLAVTLIAGVPAAYTLTRFSSRLTRAFEEIITLPLAIPGLAIALALLISYSAYGDFRKSWLFILTGHVLYTMPFMVRSVMAILASTGIAVLEEAAAALGAGPFRRFFEIVIPNVMPGILAGSLMVVTLSIGEFNLTWMLHTPLTKTLPVGLADSYASMRLEIASAYTLIFLIMVVPLLVALQVLGRFALAPGGSSTKRGAKGPK